MLAAQHSFVSGMVEITMPAPSVKVATKKV
jgi:hypothetical protein